MLIQVTMENNTMPRIRKRDPLCFKKFSYQKHISPAPQNLYSDMEPPKWYVHKPDRPCYLSHAMHQTSLTFIVYTPFVFAGYFKRIKFDEKASLKCFGHKIKERCRYKLRPPPSSIVDVITFVECIDHSEMRVKFGWGYDEYDRAEKKAYKKYQRLKEQQN
uniref:Uncharacterized protein n=1 Tax=Megaselia scalaris TaxID=36166 RepID=T1GAM4_MEGSC